MFCGPAQANGRWGRVSRREVAGPISSSAITSGSLHQAFREGAAQSRCMEIAAAHTHEGRKAVLPAHHGVTPRWSQHDLLSPHFLSTLPLFSPTSLQTLWCVWRNHTPYPPRLAASRTTRGPQRHRLLVVCRRGQVPPSREPSLQATLSPLDDLQRDRDHNILSVAQVDLALDC